MTTRSLRARAPHPKPVLGSLTLLFLTALPLCGSAQEGGEAKGDLDTGSATAPDVFDTTNLDTPVFPTGYRIGDAFRIRLQTRFLPAANFDDFDVDLYEPSLRVQATLPLSKRVVLQLTGRFGAAIYDVDGTSDFLGTGRPSAYPFDDFLGSSLALQAAGLLNRDGHLFVEGEKWSILANVFGRSEWEIGSFTEGLRGGGTLALGYEIEKLIRIAVGVGLQSSDDGGGLGVDPALTLRWNVTDRITLRNRGRGLQVEYRLNRELEIFAAGFVESTKARLGRRAGLPNDLSFRDQAVQAGLGFEWKMSQYLRMNAEAGVVAKRTLRVKSRELGTLWKEHGDPSAYLEFRLELRP